MTGSLFNVENGKKKASLMRELFSEFGWEWYLQGNEETWFCLIYSEIQKYTFMHSFIHSPKFKQLCVLTTNLKIKIKASNLKIQRLQQPRTVIHSFKTTLQCLSVRFTQPPGLMPMRSTRSSVHFKSPIQLGLSKFWEISCSIGQVPPQRRHASWIPSNDNLIEAARSISTQAPLSTKQLVMQLLLLHCTIQISRQLSCPVPEL